MESNYLKQALKLRDLKMQETKSNWSGNPARKLKLRTEGSAEAVKQPKAKHARPLISKRLQ